MDGDRYQPPRIEPAAAALSSSLARRRVPAAAGRYAVRIGAVPDLVDAEVFAITLGGAPASIEAPRVRVTELLASLDPAAPAAEGAARRLLVELALDDVAAALDSVLPVGPADDPPDAPISVGLLLGDWDAALRLSEDAAWRLLTALELLPPDPVVVPAPTPMSLRLGACELPLHELRESRPGDVLLPSAGLDDDAFVLVVSEERWVWQARRASEPGGGVELVSPRCRAAELGMEGWMMDDGTPAALADASLDDLPVRVVFEAGRIEVPMGELALIGPGHVFQLPGGIGLIDVLANGRRIGQGELVQVGDAAGVRLLRLNS